MISFLRFVHILECYFDYYDVQILHTERENQILFFFSVQDVFLELEEKVSDFLHVHFVFFRPRKDYVVYEYLNGILGADK